MSGEERPSAANLAAELEEARRRIALLEAAAATTPFGGDLVQHMLDGFSLLDADGVHLEVNPALCAMTGFSRDELVGTGPPHPYWPPEERGATRAALVETQAGQTATFPLTFMRKSGERFPVLVTPSVVRDATGAVVGAFATVKDVGELRRTQAALEESETLFRLTFEHAPIGAALAGTDFRFRRVNEVFCRMTGYSAGELLHMGFPDITHPDDVAGDHAGIRRLMAGEIAEHAREQRYLRKDGSIAWGAVVVRPVRSADGHVLALLALIEDITERRRAQEAAGESSGEVMRERDRLAALLASVPDEIWFADADGRFTLANRAAEDEFLLRSEEETPVRELAASLEVLRVDGTPRPIEEAPPLRALRGETVRNQEELVRTPATGELRRRLVTSTPVYDADGAIVGSVSVVRDVTDLQRAEEALLREQERAQRYVDIAGVMLVAIAPDGTVTLANRRTCEVLGREEDEIVRHDWFDVAIPAEVREPTREVFGAMLRGEVEPWEHWEDAVVTAGGDIRLIAWRNVVVRDDEGAVVTSLRSGEDVTEQRRAEQALAESEERYRLLVRSAYDAVYLHEISSQGPGRLLDVNERACEMLGYTREELLALGVDAIDTPEQRARSPEISRRVLETGHAVFETDHVRKDGSLVPVEISASVFELRGRPAILSVVRDITERRAAQQALGESEEKYREVVERASDGVIITDDERILFANHALARMTGYAVGELVGSPFIILFREEDRDDVSRRVSRRLAGEQVPTTFENDFVRKDGTAITVETSAGVIAYQGRRADLMVVRDVTERRRAEGEIREAEQRYRSLFEESPVAIWEEDASGVLAWLSGLDEAERDGLEASMMERPRMLSEVARMVRLTHVNRASLGVFGADREEDLIADFTRCFTDESYAALAAAVRAFAAGETSFRVRCTFLRLDGAPRTLDVTLGLLAGRGGRDRILASFVDVTEQVAAEEEIRRLNAELEARVALRTAQRDELNRELEAFAYSAAHDLRTPLRAIDGFSAVVAEDAAARLADEDREHLERVRAAAQRLGALIDDLMGLSRVSRLPLARVPVDVSAMAEEVAAELRDEHPGRTVDVQVAPGMTASADPALLRIILRRLLGNAWKFTEKHATASVEVGIRRTDGQVAFFVRDDGVGFDPTQAEHLFGAFQRLHTPGEYAGRGIGLATVQRLVARHGGSVWAESQVEKGATFCFTLPDEPGSEPRR